VETKTQPVENATTFDIRDSINEENKIQIKGSTEIGRSDKLSLPFIFKAVSFKIPHLLLNKILFPQLERKIQ
jgi:hypothetical protein